MRQVRLRVSAGNGDEIAKEARELGAFSAIWWPANEDGRKWDIVSLVIENRSVGSVLDALHGFNDAAVLLPPHEVLVFGPPASRPPKELQQLEERSPLEIFLLSIQSVGSWPSFLGYAAAGAILTWIAFFTNSVYLVIAAMLIAPFAGPAMNVALATASGDSILFRRSLARYFVGILATSAVTALLGFVFQQSVVTDLMSGVGHTSAAAALLPIVAGAAGAFNLVQSERSSLVSGTAVGMLVTASLAPPAALVGVAAVMQQWPLVRNAVFLLLLQLVGINLGGALIFRWRGLTPSLREYERGSPRLFYVSIIISTLALGGLLTWQFTDPLRLERSSRSTQVAQAIRSVLEDDNRVRLIHIDTSFTNSDAYGENTLLATIYVERAQSGGLADAQLRPQLRREIQNELQEQNPALAPLVNVVLMDPPPATPSQQTNGPGQ